MISNQILRSTIDGIKGITKIDISVYSIDGHVLASTYDDDYEYAEQVVSFVNSQAEIQTVSGCHFFKVFDEKILEFIVVIKSDGDDAYMLGKLAAFQLSNLVTAYKERYDKDNFIKNLLLDNLLLVDIYTRAKKLHIEPEAKRVVFIIETHKEKDTAALETIRSLRASETHDFITAVDEKNIILVKELKQNEDYQELEQTGRVILDTLNSEAMSRVNIAYGTIVTSIKDVSRSYKEAKMALDVGKIFFSDQRIVAYAKLGIGRLIYQLPPTLCRMYIKEVFENCSPDELDDELLSTVNVFFDENLNVSETSRQMFVHRNTLVYRLDKFKEKTGLDLRNFDDAVTFKIALMVVKYMNYMDNQEDKYE